MCNMIRGQMFDIGMYAFQNLCRPCVKFVSLLKGNQNCFCVPLFRGIMCPFVILLKEVFFRVVVFV